MICKPDHPKDEDMKPDPDNVKKGHGGCRHIQPQIRKEGLNLFVQYKKAKYNNKISFGTTRILYRYLPW
jgi:DNA-directed RNA polymerase II subunit RPB1